MIKPRLEIKFPIKYQYWYISRRTRLSHDKNTFLVNHARTGIILALKALNLPQNSKIGMMCYNCKSVMNAIQQCGFQIVFIDVTDTLTIDLCDLNKKKHGMQALIVSHLFGIPNNITSIRNIVPNIPIIEDCAHAFGSCGCGEYGDFAVYSLGLGKLPSIGDGGILHINNNNYLQYATKKYNSLKDYTIINDCALYVKLLLKSILYSHFIYSFVTYPLLKKKRHQAVANETIVTKKMSKGIECIASHILPKFDDTIKIRRSTLRNYYYCVENGNYDIVPIYDTFYNGFMAPFVCNHLYDIKIQLRRKGFEVETHFKQAIEWAKEFGYVNGECPNSEKLTQKLLILPTYYSIPLL